MATESQRFGIPEKHSGSNYTEVLSALSAKRSCQTYLEIGVSNGTLMSQIETEVAVGVDPGFELNTDVTKNKKIVHLYRMTSDLFFSKPEFHLAIKGRIDLAFLDGMHNFEFLLRDFFNTERLCNERSLIALHDCLPLNEMMVERIFWKAVERGEGTPFPMHWTGDVWKIIPILKTYRPDLQLVFVDAAPTGLVFVTNLDSKSDTLRANYLNIVKEFSRLGNNESAICDMFNSLNLTSTEDVLNSFDHSCYFMT